MEKKVAIITGASRGIGAGIAKSLANAGFSLVLVCEKREDTLNALAEVLSENYNIDVLTHVGDISKESFVSEIQESVRLVFGRVDVLVNNAGIWDGSLITETSLDVWSRLIDVNLTGTFLMSKAFIPMMIHQKSGSIINISSIWGITGAACEVAYSATKGGINAFTKAVAKELAPSFIQVNAIAPGVIDTEMMDVYSTDEKEDLIDNIPLGRMGTPEDIGRAVISLLSTPYITGQIITVDGGFL